MTSTSSARRTVLLLCTTTGYQAHAFTAAAEKIGADVVFGSDRCHVLDDPWRDGAIPVHFENPDAAAQAIVQRSRDRHIDGVVALGDRPTATAARVAQSLGLPGHPPEAADICRDKYRSRQVLRDAGLEVPAFQRFPLHSDLRQLAASMEFPCVLKPLALSGSRGVIRADTPEAFVRSFERIAALLRSPDVGVLRELSSNFIQVETYIEGVEVAVEGLMDRGRLHVLAIFDKPDPLTGPYFEETLYVTPSRLPAHTQPEIRVTVERAVQALGLFDGPLHAELRLNRKGAWLLEIAARPIGGLCARSLRLQQGMTLEELILRYALGERFTPIRDSSASGVLMIPIPQAGILEQVENIDAAARTSNIEAIEITAKPREKLVPLPEGSSYLGFIFARAASPEAVENALRQANSKLRFVISPALPVI